MNPTCAARVQVIKNLQLTGSYRITNNIGANPYFEKAERLAFFDPS